MSIFYYYLMLLLRLRLLLLLIIIVTKGGDKVMFFIIYQKKCLSNIKNLTINLSTSRTNKNDILPNKLLLITQRSGCCLLVKGNGPRDHSGLFYFFFCNSLFFGRGCFTQTPMWGQLCGKLNRCLLNFFFFFIITKF